MGADECGVCHENVQGHELMPAYHSQCESCHGGGSLHAESEETADIRFPANNDCMGCHAIGFASHQQWDDGDHDAAGVLCSDCHNSHNRQPKDLRVIKTKRRFREADDASRLCVQCHSEIEARFQMPSHHPVG